MGWRERATSVWRRGGFTLAGSVSAAALGVVLLQVGIALIGYARLAGAALSFPYPLDYSEGPVLDQVMRLTRLESIYPPSFSAPPYTLATTPPLYQLLQTPLAAWLGPAFWYGRLISIAGAIAAATLIGLILYTLTRDGAASVVAALFLLTMPYFLRWSIYARADTLALALSLAGLYVLVHGRAARQASPRTVWLSGLLLAAAVFARQTYALAAPVAALVWLLHSRQRRAALMLAGIVVGCVLAVSLGLTVLTRGGFYRHLAFATTGPIAWPAVTGHAAGLYLNAGYLLVVCLMFVVVEPLGERTRSWPLVAAYCACTALTLVAAGQAFASGADLFPISATLCLGAGALLAWTGERHWLRAGCLLLLALQANQLATWSREEFRPAVARPLSQTAEIASLAELVQEAPGPVLADEYMGLLPLFGQRLHFQPYEFRQLAAANLWDAAPLVDAIERQQFAAILLFQPPSGPGFATRWAPELRQAIYAHYATDDTLANNIIYLPQP